jgi:hypothetical protein
MLLQRPSGGALPNSVQFTQGTTKLLEGPWQMLEDNSNIYNRIEAAAILAMLVEFGNANPATWQGGNYRLFILGAGAGNTMWISEMGAFPATQAQYQKTKQAAITSLAIARSTSSAPASAAVSAVTNGKQATTASVAINGPIRVNTPNPAAAGVAASTF